MAKNEPERLDKRAKEAGSYAKYMGLAFQMIAIIGIFTFAGYKIDESAGHTTKWVTAALSLAGVFASLYLVIRTVGK
ncbi:AtpZ/AtpI family protein [Mucilaginibacter psychrotolerans]|uniref:AtpZ/AtpI family protein n=1 Tax=Mucilaginibacter psychrotolerans TaxID=1524096 RepID=A0A4Y8SQF1_9SPHI|nr:AtpZ/AtpI family protein [Mucilaginibacter psychrotolerans]TFF40757.1 AtpZ/AtpI family protein [Mucilaginibacter psychrotolerans]